MTIRPGKRGFTLVELLVVIALIALAATLVIYALAKLYKVVKGMFGAAERGPEPPALVWQQPPQPVG